MDEWSVLFLLLLAVAVSNFRLYGSQLLMMACGLFLIVKYYAVKVPAAFFPIMVFSCIYLLTCLHHKGLVGAMKIFVCPLLWLVGYNMPEARKLSSVFKVASILAFGMAFHGLLNYLYNSASGVDMTTGVTMDVWSGQNSSATCQATNFTLFLSILFWLLCVQKKGWLKMLSAFFFVCSMLYAIQLGSRSYLILGVPSVVCSLHFRIRSRTKNLLSFLLILLLSCGLFAFCYRKDLWGLRSYIENSYLVYRMELDRESFFSLQNNSRFYFKAKYLENMFAVPWGGGHLRERIVGSHAHDLWLDMMDDTGIPGLLALLVYSIGALSRILRVRKDRILGGGEKAALLGYAITMHAQFFVEPIWQGAPILFCCFVMIDGMLAGWLTERSKMACCMRRWEDGSL